ncbi:hypothetical protein [Streptomyces malaysiensis]|nr:hypothetical protein [Streptomyces malaysiensis]
MATGEQPVDEGSGRERSRSRRWRWLAKLAAQALGMAIARVVIKILGL